MSSKSHGGHAGHWLIPVHPIPGPLQRPGSHNSLSDSGHRLAEPVFLLISQEHPPNYPINMQEDGRARRSGGLVLSLMREIICPLIWHLAKDNAQ
ncbi:hypothetical protein D5086_017217 [Populus alba]|uniref:Uncharacterized protein n=1 Tax=Populus alba TaxID=43335 RepID=A0ACC4BWV2_POPAL